MLEMDTILRWVFIMLNLLIQSKIKGRFDFWLIGIRRCNILWKPQDLRRTPRLLSVSQFFQPVDLFPRRGMPPFL
jgi:hypothetical protein